MATINTAQDQSIGSPVAGPAEGATGEAGKGQLSASAPLGDLPVRTAPKEIVTSAFLPLPQPALPPPTPTVPTVSKSGLAETPRPSTKNRSDYRLRGPVPQKGSGQDRFRQLLEEKDKPHSSTLVMAMGANQVPLAAQSYSPGLSADTPPPVMHRGNAFRRGNREADGAVEVPVNSREDFSPVVKTEHGDSATTRAGSISRGTSSSSAARSVPNGLQHPLATARLSAQCQVRRFNPKWYESSDLDGFRCSVQVMDKIIHGDRAHTSAYNAKQAVAEKALSYVNRLPLNVSAMNSAARHRAADEINYAGHQSGRGQGYYREPAANAGPARFQPQYIYPSPANPVGYNWDSRNHHEQVPFLRHIQSIFGGAGPSPAVLADPLAAQAFLQGLAVGTTVQSATPTYGRQAHGPPMGREIYRPYEARERSPAPPSNYGRQYRERSPRRRRM